EPLVLEERAELVALGGVHDPLTAAARRASASSAPIPSRATTLSRAAWPETIATLRRRRSRVPASRVTTASFARPPSAGAATLIFHESPCRPTTPGLVDPGTTRSSSLVEACTPLSLRALFAPVEVAGLAARHALEHRLHGQVLHELALDHLGLGEV